MAANNTDSMSGDSSDGKKLAALRKLRTGLVRQKHQLELKEFQLETAIIKYESIDVSQIDLSAWDDFQ
jgi:hypothetical protein